MKLNILQRYPTGQEFVVQSIVGINHGGLGRFHLLSIVILSYHLLDRCRLMGLPNDDRYHGVRLRAGNVAQADDAVHPQPVGFIPPDHDQRS